MRRLVLAVTIAELVVVSGVAPAAAAPWHGTVETTYQQDVTESGITQTTKTHSLIALRRAGSSEEHHAKGPGDGDLDYLKEQAYDPPRSDDKGCRYSTVTTSAFKSGLVMAGDGDSMIEYEIAGPMDTGSGSAPVYQLFARDQTWLPEVVESQTFGACGTTTKPPSNWRIAAGGGTFEAKSDGTIQGTWVEEDTTTISGQTVTTRVETTAGLSRQFDTDRDCIPDLKELSDMFDPDPTGCIDPLLAENDKSAHRGIERNMRKVEESSEIAGLGCDLDPECPPEAEALYDLAELFALTVGGKSGDLANDPPDPNYDRQVNIATPAPKHIRPIRGFLPKRAAEALERWINNQQKAAATSRALLHAIERWQGAHRADDFVWRAKHARRAGPIAKSLSRLYRSAAGLAVKLGAELKGTGFGSLPTGRRPPVSRIFKSRDLVNALRSAARRMNAYSVRVTVPS